MFVPGASLDEDGWNIGIEVTKDGFIATLNNRVGTENVAYVRFSVYIRSFGDSPMVSIDAPIEYSVEGFLADDIKVKGENVIGEPGVGQPDWIAKKKLEGGEIIILPEVRWSGSGLLNGFQQLPQAGIIYDVYWGGVLYPCTAFDNDGATCLGNGSLLAGSTMANTGEPFCITNYGGTGSFVTRSDSGAVTVKITDHAYYVYDKMPVEYLPNECLPPFYFDLTENGNGGYETAVKVSELATVIADGRLVIAKCPYPATEAEMELRMPLSAVIGTDSGLQLVFMTGSFMLVLDPNGGTYSVVIIS